MLLDNHQTLQSAHLVKAYSQEGRDVDKSTYFVGQHLTPFDKEEAAVQWRKQGAMEGRRRSGPPVTAVLASPCQVLSERHDKAVAGSE